MKKRYAVALNYATGLARELAPKLRGGEILALVGPLGSGKTTFTKALAKELGIRKSVTSPTFTIMNRYPLKKIPNCLFLYHLDLYRTNSFPEVEQLGITEVWATPETVTILEWADKIQDHLPKKTIFIYFSHT